MIDRDRWGHRYLIVRGEQAERQLERNRDQLLQDLGLARQRELDELRGRIDRLERMLRQRASGDVASLQDTDFPPD